MRDDAGASRPAQRQRVSVELVVDSLRDLLELTLQQSNLAVVRIVRGGIALDFELPESLLQRGQRRLMILAFLRALI